MSTNQMLKLQIEAFTARPILARSELLRIAQPVEGDKSRIIDRPIGGFDPIPGEPENEAPRPIWWENRRRHPVFVR